MNESIFSILLCIFFLFYAFHAAIVFTYRSTPVFMKRRPLLVMLNSLFLFNLLVVEMCGFSMFIDSQKQFPNWLDLVCSSLGYTLTQMNFCVRILNLVYEYCVNRLRITHQQATFNLNSLKKVEQFAFWYFSLFGLNRDLKGKRDSIDPHLIQSKVSIHIQLMAQIPIPFISLITSFIASLMATSSLDPPDISLNVLYIPSIICNSVLIISEGIMLFLILHVKDGLSIKQEYVACITVNIIAIIPCYIGNFIDISPKSTGNGVYIVGFAVIVQMIDVWYPLYLLHQTRSSSSNLMTKVKRKESLLIEFDMNSYTMVMNDPKRRQELTNLLASELCIENAYFIHDFNTSKESLYQTSIQSERTHLIQETHSIAERLFEKYIQEGSPFQLNITAEMVNQVKSGLNETGNSSLACFDPVFVEVNDLVYRNTFARYVKQQLKKRPSTKPQESIE